MHKMKKQRMHLTSSTPIYFLLLSFKIGFYHFIFVHPMICFSFEAPILESTWIWICVGSVQYRLALPYFSC